MRNGDNIGEQYGDRKVSHDGANGSKEAVVV